MTSTLPVGPPRQTRWGPEQRAREHELLDRLATLEPGDPAGQAVRDEIVLMHMPLVEHLARRYRDRGEALEDLVQVGTVGLIKAVDNFDPDRGVELVTYATPKILGEIKRHFRDHAWALHMPRRMQELQTKVAMATDALTFELGRSPTVREIAERADLTVEEVLDSLEARQARSASSLDVPFGASQMMLADTIGKDDPGMERINERESVAPLLDALPEREREIVKLRFYEGLSQTRIAERMGISQMHVSRLLAKSLAQMRTGLSTD